MEQNPYRSPHSPLAAPSGVERAMPSTAARFCSLVFISFGAVLGTLALVIVSELIRLRFGASSVFEDTPVPTWMALISGTLATVLIGFGILIRRASSRNRSQPIERS